MKRNRVLTLLSTLLMMIMMLSMLTVTAFAAEGAIDEDGETLNSAQEAWLEDHIIAANSSGFTGDSSWMRSYLTVNPDESDGQTVLFTFNGDSNGGGVNFYAKKGVEEKDIVKQVVKSYKSGKTVENVSNITDGLNIEADTAGAAAMLQGFSPIISLVLGIIVTLIMIGMTIYSAFDIAYIAFPVFRNKCEDAKAQGNGPMVKKTANGSSGLRFVTDDAQYAVSQGTVENGRSPWGIYFKKRIGSYIFLAIITFILLTGNISLLTNIALKIVSGIMNVLNGLA